MTSLRSSILLNHNASDVWNVVREASDVSQWFPSMRSSEGDEKTRTVVLGDGTVLVEDIVTLDDDRRRLQYRVVDGGLEVNYHLGTIDVFEIDRNRSLVAYSTEIEPPELADAFHSAIDEAVQGLTTYLG